MVNAYIQLNTGEGLSGASCSPAQSPNPVTVFGEPFGHAFMSDLDDLLEYCDCSIDTPTTSYDVNALSCQHEIAFNYHRIYGGTELVNGHTYVAKMTWKKGTTIIHYDEWNIVWDTAYTYWHGYGFIGWTPCWWWAGGSLYNGYEEIKDDGTDYLVKLELYDGASLLCDNTVPFTVTNLTHHHTSIYWDHIQDYTGAEVDGNFGMKASEYVLDVGTNVWGTQYFRQKNLDCDAVMKVDGFAGAFVDLQAFRSGYVKRTLSCAGVVSQNLNGPYDFTGGNYLQASVEGMVHDADGLPLPNANIYGTSYSPAQRYYGCKSASDGKYALPFHLAGTYSVHGVKNNFLIKTHSGASIVQSGDHPASKTTRNFTVGDCLNRVSAYPTGAYAHLDALASAKQSIIIPDDPLTSDVPIIPTSVGATIVKVRNRAAPAGSTSMGTSDNPGTEGRGYGSGGFNYEGDMGDGEGWSNAPEHPEDTPPPPLYYYLCAGSGCEALGYSPGFWEGQKSTAIVICDSPSGKLDLIMHEPGEAGDGTWALDKGAGDQFTTLAGNTYEIDVYTSETWGCWIKFHLV